MVCDDIHAVDHHQAQVVIQPEKIGFGDWVGYNHKMVCGFGKIREGWKGYIRVFPKIGVGFLPPQIIHLFIVFSMK